MTTHAEVAAVIDQQLSRPDLSAEDVLHLTLAKRLNDCSENTLAKALGGAETPLNFWGKR
jgi:hypothetical protein